MEACQPSYLKGHILVAMPGLNDPNFFKSVTCICEHVETGAVGIIVNRVHPSLYSKDIFQELNIDYLPKAASIPIHIGGPVHMGEIFVLHGPPFGWEGCLHITTSLAMSNTKDILEAIAKDQGPESFLLILGCAGWGQGQLDSEIKGNAWLTWPVFNEIIFDIPPEDRWNESMKRVGVDPALLSDTPGHA